MNEINKVALKILLFIIVISIVFLSLNSIYKSFVFDTMDIYEYEDSYQEFLSSNTTDIQYAFIGDSHTKENIDSSQFVKSYNFGFQGENPADTYYKYKRSIEDNVSSKVVILQLDTHMFSRNLDGPQDILKPYHYFLEFVPLSQVSELKEIPETQLYLRKNFFLFGNGWSFVQYWFRNVELKDEEDLWRDSKSRNNVGSLQKIASDRCYELFGDKHPNDLSTIYMEFFLKTLALAEDKNSTIVFVSHPVTRFYDDEIQKYGFDRQKFNEELFDAIHDEIGENYIYLDYYELYYGKPYYFRDSDHLRYDTKREFTSRLKNDLLRELDDAGISA
ncbi:MAG: hypothetical protein ACQESE_04350 [Nanobdellota archaeon]